MSEQLDRNPSLASAKRQRTRKTVSFQLVEEAEATLEMTDVQLSQALFQSDGVVGGWRKEGLAPAWVTLALECLINKVVPLANETRLFIAKVPSIQVETFCNVASALGARITKIE